MRLSSSPWSGFILGVLFGTAGMWILAMLSLVLQPVELLTAPLFWPGRWLSSLTAGDDGSMGNLGVALLMGANGLLYGGVGALLHVMIKKSR